MEYYFAPMEGITGYIFRRTHHRFFPGIDKYFSPFISPGSKKVMTPRERRDILPENNEGCRLVPQILTNKAQEFCQAARELWEYGYREVNLNLGCPSGTVVSKGKGAGFLEEPEKLDRFLAEIFENVQGDISIKTRIGTENPEEFDTLLEIYKKYPVKELIIHPRLLKDYYKNKPDWKAFQKAGQKLDCPLCYNGDLFTLKRCREFTEQFPETQSLMLGRGLLRNPCLIRELKGEENLTKEKLKAFHDALCSEYEQVMSGDRSTLFKMKELWFYMGDLFPDSKKYLKKIKKTQKVTEYRQAVEELFRERDCDTTFFMLF